MAEGHGAQAMRGRFVVNRLAHPPRPLLFLEDSLEMPDDHELVEIGSGSNSSRITYCEIQANERNRIREWGKGPASSPPTGEAA